MGRPVRRDEDDGGSQDHESGGEEDTGE